MLNYGLLGNKGLDCFYASKIIDVIGRFIGVGVIGAAIAVARG